MSRPQARRFGLFARRCRPARLAAWVAAALVTSAACGDSNGLSDPILTNVVDTVTLGALVGTPVTTPSAFSVASVAPFSPGAPVRSDQTSAFDFAFNIDPGGKPVFLPLSVLGLGTKTSVDPGLRATTQAFADITRASDGSYVNQDTVPFAVGDRFIARSRIACGLLSVPQYGKLEVLDIDETERSVTFQVLTNNNCGYKDLTPGLPAH